MGGHGVSEGMHAGTGDTGFSQEVKEALDTVRLAVAGTGAIAAAVHLGLVGLQVPQGDIAQAAGATVCQKRQQVQKVVAIVEAGFRGEVARRHSATYLNAFRPEQAGSCVELILIRNSKITRLGIDCQV